MQEPVLSRRTGTLVNCSTETGKPTQRQLQVQIRESDLVSVSVAQGELYSIRALLLSFLFFVSQLQLLWLGGCSKMPPRPVSHSPPQPQQQPQPHLVATPLLIVLFAETPIRGPTTLKQIFKRKNFRTSQKLMLFIKQTLRLISLYGNPIKK